MLHLVHNRITVFMDHEINVLQSISSVAGIHFITFNKCMNNNISNVGIHAWSIVIV